MKIKNNISKFTLEDQINELELRKNKKNLNMNFNRIAFIFFIFFLISVIYSIHLTHLGSRNTNQKSFTNYNSLKLIQRADIIDISGNFLAKTVNSIDIGINPVEIIDKKKLLLNLRYIFPNKNYSSINTRIEKKKIFLVRKKNFR